MPSLKYHVGLTLDGFIAHPDHTVDGFAPFAQGDHVDDFFDSHRTFDAVLMGRRTYEFGLRFGVTSPYPTMRQLVFSTTMTASPDPAVELVSSGAVERVRALKRGPETGKDIWLCGGCELASTLLEAGLLDEVVIKLYPLLFGAGIPLFARQVATTALELRHQKCYRSGVQLLTYRVVPPPQQAAVLSGREEGEVAYIR